MFERSGEIIKKFALVWFYVSAGAFLIGMSVAFIVAVFSGIYVLVFVGILGASLGILLSYISANFIYGYGELIDSTIDISDKVSKMLNRFPELESSPKEAPRIFPKSRECPNCGKSVPVNDFHCPDCGKSMR